MYVNMVRNVEAKTRQLYDGIHGWNSCKHYTARAAMQYQQQYK